MEAMRCLRSKEKRKRNTSQHSVDLENASVIAEDMVDKETHSIHSVGALCPAL